MCTSTTEENIVVLHLPDREMLGLQIQISLKISPLKYDTLLFIKLSSIILELKAPQ